MFSGNERFCPVCEHSSSRFLACGVIPRKDAVCPFCNSKERHRLAWVYMEKNTNLFSSNYKTVLHIAPEKCFIKRLEKRIYGNYITADLVDPKTMVKMNIMDIAYKDESFDIIICSHVLEHVDDDRKAMREFYRTLKSGGWALLLVPITAEITFEDSSITSAEGRLAAFGQSDHARRYGPDYIMRLRKAGFSVEMKTIEDLHSTEEIVKMGMTNADAGEIYFCTK